MIQFTFESFYMAVFFSNLMILLLYLLFRKGDLVPKLGVSVIGAVFFIIVLRMAFPYELLFLSHNIYFTGTPALIAGAIPAERFFGDRLSIWSLIMMAWLGGAVFEFIRFLMEERVFSAMIKASGREVLPSSGAGQAFERVREEFPRLQRIRICTLPGCESPFVYGFFKPRIFLPEGMELGEREMYYVLRHEASHYLHYDLYLKFFVKSLCVLYWWNPVCHFLWRKADTLLEMRVDRSIVKEPAQKVEYLNCLLSVAEYVAGKNRVSGSSRAVAFCGESSSELRQRFQMLLNEERKISHKVMRTLFISGAAALFVLSYVYIFEPAYVHPEDMIGVITPGPDNAYFIEREDGRYDFYLEGEFTSTEDSLDYFNDKIPIYKAGAEMEHIYH